MKNKRNFDFIGKAPLFGGISAALLIISLLYIIFKGLPYGIDFAGGSEIQVSFSESVKIEELRSLTNTLGVSHLSVQEFGSDKEFLIRFQLPEGQTPAETNKKQNEIVNGLQDKLNQSFSSQKPQIVRADSVGPQVGAELKKMGFLALFYSLIIILAYVGLRFDYKYAPGAVICLFHDAVIALTVFALSGREINVPIIAAILTLIGFSLNDTIVVFDRIRETESHHSKLKFSEIINRAINDMFERTVITSGTTLSVSLALLFLTTGAVSDIAFIMSVGIIVGTYSSIYVAAPLALLLDKFMGDKPLNIIPKPRYSE